MKEDLNIEKNTKNERKIKIMVDKIPFKVKPDPDKGDVGVIQNRLKNSNTIEEVTVNQLFDYISKGYTIRPGILIDGASEENFKQQELIFIDVDNKVKENSIPLDKALSILKENDLKVLGYYYTFSHTNDIPRFRILLLLDKPVIEINKMNLILGIINDLIPNADTSCAKGSKLFYGTNGKEKVTIIDPNATVTFGEVMDLYNPSPIDNYTNDNKLSQSIKDFNLLDYIQKYTKILRKSSNYIAFDDCPICGHKDCLRYYPATNSFYCFGANGCIGGSIIEFKMAVEKIDKKTSLENFRKEYTDLQDNNQDTSVSVKDLKLKHRQIIEEQIKKLKIKVTLPKEINWISYRPKKDEIFVEISCPLLAKFIQQNIYYYFIETDTDEKVPKYFYENGSYKLYSDNKVKKIIMSLIPLNIWDDRDIETVFYFLCKNSDPIDMDIFNNDDNIVSLKDCILHLREWKTENHNPKFLITTQIDCNFSELKPYSKNGYFDNYLSTLTNGDKEQQNLLEEFGGVVTSNIDGSKMKQALILCGSGDTGKSKFLNILEEIVGKKNYTSADLRSMEKNFSRINLLNKRLASFSDVTSLRLASLDQFKKITGGDSLNDSWKHRDSLDFIFKGTVIMTMNEFLKFGGDAGDHVWERFVPIETINVIPKEKQDKDLVKHILEDKGYVVYKFLQAARQVIQNGYNYTIPESCIKLRKKYRVDHNSILRFIKECTEKVIREPETDDCTTGQFYKIYKNWCKDNNNNYYESSRDFRKAILKETGENAPKKTFGGNYYYRFIIPIDEIKKDYGYDMSVFR